MLLVLHRMDVTALLPIFRDRLELQQSTLVVIGINAILYIITCSANRYGQASHGIRRPSVLCVAHLRARAAQARASSIYTHFFIQPIRLFYQLLCRLIPCSTLASPSVL